MQMKNRTLLIFAGIIICITALLVVGFTANFDKKNNNETSTSTVGSVSVNKNDDSLPVIKNELDVNVGNLENLAFTISDKSIVKRKEYSGDITSFIVTFKLFVTNNSDSELKVLSSGFHGEYDIKDYALFYSFECLDEENYKIIKSNESVDFDFSIKYIVTNVNEFNDNAEYSLDLNYINTNVVSVFA